MREDLRVVEWVSEPPPNQVGREGLPIAEGKQEEELDSHPQQLPFREGLVGAVWSGRRATDYIHGKQRPIPTSAELGEKLINLRRPTWQQVAELLEQEGTDRRVRFCKQALAG
jgi:hypothetical protein